MNNETRFPAPIPGKCLILSYVGEIRFGPEYFRARAEGFSADFKNILVGEQISWNSDGTILAISILNTTESSNPPDIDIAFVNTEIGNIKIMGKIRVVLFNFIGFTEGNYFLYEEFDKNISGFCKKNLI